MVIGWQLHADRLSVFQIVTPPTFLLGLLGYLMARHRPRRVFGRPWLVWHVAGQGGSYIGVITATAFQIFPRFVPPSLILTIVLFVVPSVVGTVVITRTLRLRIPAGSPI